VFHVYDSSSAATTGSVSCGIETKEQYLPCLVRTVLVYSVQCSTLILPYLWKAGSLQFYIVPSVLIFWRNLDRSHSDIPDAQGMHIVPHLQSSAMFRMGDRPSQNPGHHRPSLNPDSPYGSLLRHNTAASPLQIQAQIIIVSGVRLGKILWHKTNHPWLVHNGRTSPRSRTRALRDR
jgi:hypothetical protein